MARACNCSSSRLPISNVQNQRVASPYPDKGRGKGTGARAAPHTLVKVSPALIDEVLDSLRTFGVKIEALENRHDRYEEIIERMERESGNSHQKEMEQGDRLEATVQALQSEINTLKEVVAGAAPPKTSSVRPPSPQNARTSAQLLTDLSMAHLDVERLRQERNSAVSRLTTAKSLAEKLRTHNDLLKAKCARLESNSKSILEGQERMTDMVVAGRSVREPQKSLERREWLDTRMQEERMRQLNFLRRRNLDELLIAASQPQKQRKEEGWVGSIHSQARVFAVPGQADHLEKSSSMTPEGPYSVLGEGSLTVRRSEKQKAIGTQIVQHSRL